jgi:dipeptidyl aminopeptidase/acylaminoacyl peptidase
MPSNGGKEREIPTGPAAWGPRSSAPLWSPDGKYLLIDEIGTLEHNGYWWLLPVNGGPARRIDTSVRPDKFVVQQTYQWLSDNRILFSAGRQSDPISKIWISRLSGDWSTAGVPVRATDTTDLETAACATPNLLAFVRQSAQINLWTLPVDGNAGKVLGTLRPLTHGAASVVDASLSADGKKLAFSANRSGNDFDIYVRDMASGADKLIAGTPVRELYSRLTPDGSKVAWGNVVKSGWPVFVADTEAGTMRQICDDCQGRPGAWLPDGRHLILSHVDPPKRDTLCSSGYGNRAASADSGKQLRKPAHAPSFAGRALDCVLAAGRRRRREPFGRVGARRAHDGVRRALPGSRPGSRVRMGLSRSEYPSGLVPGRALDLFLFAFPFSRGAYHPAAPVRPGVRSVCGPRH